jgi:TatD DNase family protein
MFLDIHNHIDHPMFHDDIDQVIDRATQAGLKVIMPAGINPQTNRAVLELAKKHDIIKPALGIYPPDSLAEEVKEDKYPDISEFNIDKEIEFITQQKPIALGEVGLDYKNVKDKDMQKSLFQRFIELSEKTKTPMIIHSRKAELDIIEMLESSNAKQVMLHCFCGKFSLVKRARDNGWTFSIPTSVVRSEHFQKMVEIINISQLLTETDSPYLSPFPGKRNEPAFVVEATKKIAELKNLTLEDTASNIFMNYQNMFLK